MDVSIIFVLYICKEIEDEGVSILLVQREDEDTVAESEPEENVKEEASDYEPMRSSRVVDVDYFEQRITTLSAMMKDYEKLIGRMLAVIGFLLTVIFFILLMWFTK